MSPIGTSTFASLSKSLAAPLFSALSIAAATHPRFHRDFGDVARPDQTFIGSRGRWVFCRQHRVINGLGVERNPECAGSQARARIGRSA